MQSIGTDVTGREKRKESRLPFAKLKEYLPENTDGIVLG